MAKGLVLKGTMKEIVATLAALDQKATVKDMIAKMPRNQSTTRN
jgi:hypothetical protein